MIQYYITLALNCSSADIIRTFLPPGASLKPGSRVRIILRSLPPRYLCKNSASSKGCVAITNMSEAACAVFSARVRAARDMVWLLSKSAKYESIFSMEAPAEPNDLTLSDTVIKLKAARRPLRAIAMLEAQLTASS